MWDLGVGCGLLKPGFIKDSEGEPKIPEHITCQAACAYDIYGKCTGMLSLERLNILLHAYNQSERIGLHSTTQPPVQDAATEIVGLLQRYKFQMSSLNNIGKRQEIPICIAPWGTLWPPSKNGH